MKKKGDFGKALINSTRRNKQKVKDHYELTGELPKEVPKMQNLQSVTSRDFVSDFIYTAELTQARFEGQKEKKLLTGDKIILQSTGRSKNQEEKDRQFLASVKFLKIPRRPKWVGKDADLQKRSEGENFVQWRKDLSELEVRFPEAIITPYEKNLEVWRQLWLVVERSDILVQIVDIRDYTFFRCEDLEDYVLSCGANKRNLLVINKSDLVSPKVIECVSEHLKKLGVAHLFFSAKDQLDKIEAEVPEDTSELGETPLSTTKVLDRREFNFLLDCLAAEVRKSKASAFGELDPEAKILHNMSRTSSAETVTVGMVGYPNVGKSSLINAVCGQKKAVVDSKPGKTKVLHTIHLRPGLIVCDCPGLVFPSIVASKAQMVFDGVLPIENLVEHIEPIAYLLSKVPSQLLIELYQLPYKVPSPDPATRAQSEAQNVEIAPSPLESHPVFDPSLTGLADEDVNLDFVIPARELLQIYSATRGFVGGSGMPDQAKAAKQILRDCVDGKIPHFELPKDYDAVKRAEFVKLIKKFFNPVKIPLKNVKKTDLITDQTRMAIERNQQDLLDAELMDQRKTQVSQLIEVIDEDSLLDLIEGKETLGFRLTKDDRKTLKRMVKGEADSDDVMKVLKIALLTSSNPHLQKKK